MSIQIEPLTIDKLPEASELVKRVFPWQSPTERMSFWIYAHRDIPLARAIMKASGVSDIIGFWVAMDTEAKRVLGTTGLYSYRRDASEAIWLAWFCVAPEARGHGVGSRLLDFSISEARRTNRQYLRLYTSDDHREAAAQPLYESKGLRVVRKKRRVLYTEIHRELALKACADECA